MNGTRNGQLRFVVVSPDELTRVALKRHLTAAGHRVLGETEDLKSGVRLVRGLTPDVWVLDLAADATSALEAVRKLREELPQMGMVLLSADASPQLILGGIRAGAQEFLMLPLDLGEVDRAIDRMRKQIGRLAAGVRRRGRVVAVYAAKGGVGASSVATNLALGLAMQAERKVALVDFNLQVGDLALMLDVTTEHSFARAVEDGTMDETKLDGILARHRTGVRVLTVCDRPEDSDLVFRNHVPELFGILNSMFDWVIVDLGRHIDERSIELLDLADLVLMVSALDVPTIRNTRRYLDLLDRLEIPRARVRLIVNRHQEGGRLSNRDLENTVGMSVFWSLPNEYRPMSAAIDSGNPVVVGSPRSRLARNYIDLAAALASTAAEGPAEDAAEGGTFPQASSSR
ncbi:MAG: response regulator [bacterium]